MSQPKLALVDLKKRFDAVEAVKGLSLSVQPGEFLSLLGPSGCGKSTTLSMIAGLEMPSGGDIQVDGSSIVGTPAHKRRIGLVFQDYAVFSKLSVKSNLAFGLEAQGVPRGERQQRVAEMAERLHLSAIMKRSAGRLNMSEMQRVALARVLVTEPQLLLLDEPMSNLDAALRFALRTELKQIQRALGQTVVYVTHDQLEAISMSDRIAVMRLGELQQVASPEEIYRRPANRFVAEFMGDPPINLIPCAVSRSGSEASLETALHGPLTLRGVEIAAGEQLLGIRPHDLSLRREASEGSAETEVKVVENLGAEHVAHVTYGARLVAVTLPPGTVAEGERLHLSLDRDAAILIDSGSERVVAHGLGAAA